jgi:hypothetical protein
MQSTFSKTSTRHSRDYQARPSFLGCLMGGALSRRAPASTCNLDAPFGILFRFRHSECGASGTSSPAAPRDALRIGENRAERPV